MYIHLSREKMEVFIQSRAPAALHPEEGLLYSSKARLRGLILYRVALEKKSCSLPGIEPRTVQSVA